MEKLNMVLTEMTGGPRLDIPYVPTAGIPGAVAELAAEQGRLMARWMVFQKPPPETPAPEKAEGSEKLLTIREAALRLSVTRPFLYDLIRKGALPTTKLSARNTRIKEADLIRFQKMKKGIDKTIYPAYTDPHAGKRTEADS